MIMGKSESDAAILVVITFSTNPLDHLLVFGVLSLLDRFYHLVSRCGGSKWAKSGVEENHTDKILLVQK